MDSVPFMAGITKCESCSRNAAVGYHLKGREDSEGNISLTLKVDLSAKRRELFKALRNLLDGAFIPLSSRALDKALDGISKVNAYKSLCLHHALCDESVKTAFSQAIAQGINNSGGNASDLLNDLEAAVNAEEVAEEI